MPTTYTMLGIYTFEQTNNDDFKVDFEIPDNCYYDFDEVSDEYVIAIRLNPGQTDPSTNFTSCTETAPVIKNAFITTFEQHERTGVIRKPKGHFEL